VSAAAVTVTINTADIETLSVPVFRRAGIGTTSVYYSKVFAAT